MLQKKGRSILLLCAFLIVWAGYAASCASVTQEKVVKDYELRDAQSREFQSISEQFIRTVFRPCLQQSRLTMSCSGCENIFIIVRISINADGKLAGYTKVRENVCGGTAPGQLERCFLEYLESITFPDILRSMTIETRLGTGLKC